jgi:hypothetical protein
VTGLQSANYYWQGESDDVQSEHRINGRYDNNWKFTDRAATLSFLECGLKRNLNVNQELRLTGGNSSQPASLMTMDSTDADVSTVFNIAWKKC